MATSLALFSIFSVSGGQNINALITIEPGSGTTKKDSSLICNDERQTVQAIITIKDAVELTGYMLHVEFDSTSFTFEKAEKVSTDSKEKPFLENNGGIPGPFFVKLIDKQSIDLAYGVKADKVSAVSGSGAIAAITFNCKGYKEGWIKVTKAQLSDSHLMIDTISGK